MVLAPGLPQAAPEQLQLGLAEEPLQPSRTLEQLHPSLWRAHQLGQQRGVTWPSGFAALDAELPGGGWPAGALTELLLPHPGVGEVRLLAATLVAVQRQQRCVMLFDPPAALHAWAWRALGIDLQRLIVVQARPVHTSVQARATPARASMAQMDTLWALEHALKSGQVGAVLAWLPLHLRGDALRRLQLAAQSHEGPAFLLRHSQARARPSVAPLRLLLAASAAGPDELRLRLLKRRGPPLALPLTLALTPVLSAPGRARAVRVPPAVVPAAMDTFLDIVA